LLFSKNNNKLQTDTLGTGEKEAVTIATCNECRIYARRGDGWVGAKVEFLTELSSSTKDELIMIVLSLGQNLRKDPPAPLLWW